MFIKELTKKNSLSLTNNLIFYLYRMILILLYDILFHSNLLNNILFLVLILVSGIYWWSRNKSFAIYSLLFLLIPILGKQFGGFSRYVLMDFPIQLMLYGYFRKRKFGYSVCICLTTVLWAYFLFQFAGGYTGG